MAFVLRRTVEQGTSCPDAREDVSFRKMDRPPSAMGATPQNGLFGGCSHVVQIFLGGMVLRGNPVVEQHLKSGVVEILLEHGLVALLDRRAHLALAHRPARKLGIPS